MNPVRLHQIQPHRVAGKVDFDVACGIRAGVNRSPHGIGQGKRVDGLGGFGPNVIAGGVGEDGDGVVRPVGGGNQTFNPITEFYLVNIPTVSSARIIVGNEIESRQCGIGSGLRRNSKTLRQMILKRLS